jgi:hypothetical protein
MIITNVIGGLGNQMFQYAAGLALSIERNTSLVMATDMFDTYSLHQGFELERVFGIETPKATTEMLKNSIGWRASPTVRHLLAKVASLKPLRGRHFLAEAPNMLASSFFSTPAETYLHGYWQSDRFFGRHADRIRQAFTFSKNIDSQTADMLAQIAAGPSASIHIRRGDYLSEKNASLYSQCDAEYFLTGMRILAENFSSLKFYVFSDDPVWAADFLADKKYSFKIVSHNKGVTSYNDMRLMGACDNHIISNSTFSWWGAWLNPKINKFIIAPKNWMTGLPSSQIVPLGWMVL